MQSLDLLQNNLHLSKLYELQFMQTYLQINSYVNYQQMAFGVQAIATNQHYNSENEYQGQQYFLLKQILIRYLFFTYQDLSVHKYKLEKIFNKYPKDCLVSRFYNIWRLTRLAYADYEIKAYTFANKKKIEEFKQYLDYDLDFKNVLYF